MVACDMEIRKESILGYVEGCKNGDGGYSFTWGVDSNAQDTFFALSVITSLDEHPRAPERTIGWLNSFPIVDVRSRYYIMSSLSLLKAPYERLGKTGLLDWGLKIDHMPDTLSELETMFMQVCLLRLSNAHPDIEEIAPFVLKHQNKDGGFGEKGHSHLGATFHAVSTLSTIQYDITKILSALRFAKGCERPEGGFAAVPGAFPPFIETTYAGISILEVYGASPEHPNQCIQHVKGCFRTNGGFSRSNFGITTLEFTYYAVSILLKLQYFNDKMR